MFSKSRLQICALLLAGLAGLLPPRAAFAHCDGLDGPVVRAAAEALKSGKVEPVLIWVRQQDEAEVKEIFRKALAVRKPQNADAASLADMYFFETVVRIHRAGEGVPYTGLKPAGRDLGPAIPAADKALEQGSLKDIDALVTGAVQKGLKERFEAALHHRDFNKDDVNAGREYVEAYVRYIHYVEGLHESATAASAGHYPENH